ncbi:MULTISPECIES: tripartite tricarboxylate transporter substrate binding protein [unclassified Roseobacter]|uniref:Bug family tripartite tricarboxylate transporter substrate binding protein n=1 Tax=unclassified Roseobacter TaxID=196798 RepID=UPI00209BBCE9|nr:MULTISPECIES: tripartite tricarboxylate transporter substrate-binding protein [unclassified Roseobacter]
MNMTTQQPNGFLRSRFFGLVLGVGAMLGAAPAVAQKEPYGPGGLEILVPFNAGGSADRMGRAIAQFLPEELGVPVTVVNRPGGSGALGHTFFLQQADDGSNALVTPATPYLVSNIIRGQGVLDWDEFHFINGQWQDYYMLLVNKDQPFQTAEELFAFIRDNPGEASSAIINGDGGHLLQLIMLDRMGLPDDAITFVSYDGGAPMRSAIAGNQVTFSLIAARGSEVIRDDIRPLAVVRDVPDPAWDAPVINEPLAAFGAELPILSGDLRTFTVSRAFVENEPETYAQLVAAYERMLQREDFRAFIEEGAIGGQWLGPDETQRVLDESIAVFSQYADYLK